MKGNRPSQRRSKRLMRALSDSYSTHMIARDSPEDVSSGSGNSLHLMSFESICRNAKEPAFLVQQLLDVNRNHMYRRMRDMADACHFMSSFCSLTWSDQDGDMERAMLEHLHSFVRADSIAILICDSCTTDAIQPDDSLCDQRKRSQREFCTFTLTNQNEFTMKGETVKSTNVSRVFSSGTRLNTAKLIMEPIISSASPIGILQCTAGPIASFSAREEAIVEITATWIGRLVGASLLSRRISSQAHHLRVHLRISELLLNHCSSSSVECPTSVAILYEVVQHVYELVPCERVSIFFVDRERKELVLRISPDVKGFRIPIDTGIAGSVVKAGESCRIDDVAGDPNFHAGHDPAGFKTKSVMVIPVTTDAEMEGDGEAGDSNVLALLYCVNSRNGAFSMNEQVLLEQVAALCGRVIAAIQRNERAQQEKVRLEALQLLTKGLRASTIQFSDKRQECVDLLTRASKLLRVQTTALYVWQCGSGSKSSKKSSATFVSEGASQPSAFLRSISMKHSDNDDGEVQCVEDMQTYASSEEIVDTSIRNVLMYCIKYETSDIRVVLQAVNKSRVSQDEQSSDSVTESGDRFSAEDCEVLIALAEELQRRIPEHKMEMLLCSTDDTETASLLGMYSRVRRQSIHLLQGPARQSGMGHSRAASTAFPWRADATSTRLKTGETHFRWPNPISALRLSVGTSLGWGKPMSLNDQHLMLGRVKSLSFCCFDMNPDELVHAAILLFRSTGLLKTLEVPKKEFGTLVVSIRNKYIDNPYHCWYHGFEAMRFTFLHLLHSEFASRLQDSDVLALLVAALAHDVDHPGTNNKFQIDTESELSLLYNNVSVLENHHAHVTSLLVKCSGVFNHLPSTTQRVVRSKIISIILATDMANHAHICDSITSLGENPYKSTNDLTGEARMTVLEIMMHAADLGALTLKTPIAVEWEKRISQEFTNQVEAEIAQGITTTKFMSNLKVGNNRYVLQVNFIKFVVLPMWNELMKHEPYMMPCYQNLLQNLAYFEAMRDGDKLAAAELLELPARAFESEFRRRAST